MNALWWFALPVLLLPIWWHRRKREQVKADLLATARFLPRTEPRQMRVWRWSDPLLLLLRCLLLACVVAWLADPVVPWRGDTAIVVDGTDPVWAERQIAEAGFGAAARLALPPEKAIGWLSAHEREWQQDARVLLVGAVPMPATLPRFRHRVELRTLAKPHPKTEHRVAVVSAEPEPWHRLFAALDGPRRFVVDEAPNAKTELVVWDRPEAPPSALRAPLWWVVDPAAFPELSNAPQVDGMRYADSARGRLWASSAWPPKNAQDARALFEIWQRLHYAPVAFTAPPQLLAPAHIAGVSQPSGALRETLTMVLIALFALERMLTHARRR